MWRRVIAPAPASKLPEPVLDSESKPVARLYDSKTVDLDESEAPKDWKGFYCTTKSQTTAVIDYLTEDEAPKDAIYVCEQRGPSEYVVTVSADSDFGTVHQWDGWPDPNGASAVVPKVGSAGDVVALK